MSSKYPVPSPSTTDFSLLLVSALYGILHANFKDLRATIDAFLPGMMTARAFRDAGGMVSGAHLFKAIFITFFEYVNTLWFKTISEISFS
jgi:hypothetical protein